MDGSEKQLECQICFEDFHADFAFIPELDCSCTIIVHEECWEQWSGLCLYCRNREYDDIPPITEEVRPPINYKDAFLMYVIWPLIFLAYASLFYGYCTRIPNQTQP